MTIQDSIVEWRRAFGLPAGGALAVSLALVVTSAQAETLQITISGPDDPQSFIVDLSASLAGSDPDFLVFGIQEDIPVKGTKDPKDPKDPKVLPKSGRMAIEFGDAATGGVVNVGDLLRVKTKPGNGPEISIDPILLSFSAYGPKPRKRPSLYSGVGTDLNVTVGETIVLYTEDPFLQKTPKGGQNAYDTMTITVVPEISTWAMALAGFVGMGLWRRIRVRPTAA
jgi:hypothetical protein